MQSIKVMMLGLMVILIGISVGVIQFPHPFDLILASQSSSGNLTTFHVQAYAPTVAYSIILIGVIICILGYFRKEPRP